MKELNEETALAILFANTKRKNRSVDLLTIAKSTQYLVKLYGSQKSLANRIGISTEMIREFLTTLKMPKKIRNLVSERKIDSIDIVREISTIKEPDKQIAAAKLFTNSLSKDVRDVKRLVNNSNISVEDAKEIILNAKPKGLHIFIMDFDEEMYQLITKYAKTLKVKSADLVKKIVFEWLKRQEKNK